jgi:hypothetical protein
LLSFAPAVRTVALVVSTQTLPSIAPFVAFFGTKDEGRKPKADPMAKRTPGIPGLSACHEPFGT